jgi:uncharacterized RDD family membrane protein YckC
MVQPAPVVTPEAVPLEFELAHVPTRMLALAIDLLIQAALLFVLLFAGVAVFDVTGGGGGLAMAGAYLAVFLMIWGYPTALETLWRGRTVGKAALGLRVVTREGAPVRFRHAAIRATFAPIDFYIGLGAVAILAILLTRDNQRLGDLVAGTLVLRERSALRAPRVATFHAPPGLEGYVGTLDVAGVTPSEYAAVRGFLVRAATLPPQVRGDLALQLAMPLAARLRTTPPPGVSPETFLWSLAAAYQRRGLLGAAPPAAASPMAAPLPPVPPTEVSRSGGEAAEAPASAPSDGYRPPS